MISIFIVEDDKSIQMLYQKILNLVGFRVLGVANNGAEAVTMFEKMSEKPDIILMDHRMPVKNGLEAMKEILTMHSVQKIIFASADKTVREEALAIGSVGFIDKPFSFDRLVQKIKEVIS
ncbi:MAG: response regulator [Promethearchaeota archaeon]